MLSSEDAKDASVPRDTQQFEGELPQMRGRLHLLLLQLRRGVNEMHRIQLPPVPQSA
jgi:hypothetical protein